MKRPPLKENKDLYRSIFELSPDSIVTLNTNGFITSINPAGAKIAGYPQKELIGRHFAKLGQLHFRDIPKYIRLFNSAVRGKDIKPFEIDLARKDGTSIIAEIRIGLLRDNGKVVGIQAITRDITERKNAEKEINKLASFPQLNPNPVLEVNRKGKVLFCNPAALKQFPDIIKKGTTHPILKGIYKKYGKIENEVRIGDKWYFRSSYNNNNNNKRIYYIDVTERKKAEEALKESEEKWRSFAENAPNIITISDRSGKILFINHIKHAVPGYSKKDVIGTKVYEYMPKELHSLVRKNIEYVFKTGRTGSYETQGQAPGGSISWYMTHVGPVIREGKVIAATLISTDITEHKKVEATLRESEERFRVLFESSRDALMTLEPPSWAFTSGNPATVEMARKLFLMLR